MQSTPDEPPLLPREIVCSPRFLDSLRDTLHTWTVRLHDPASGGFRQNTSIGVNPLSSTDVVWMRYAANDPDPTTPHPEALIAYLHRIQEPDTGRVRHAPGPAGQGHSDGHAFWQTVRALNILGAQLAHPPRFLAPLLSVEGLARWFDQFDWRGDWRLGSEYGNHHEVLGIVPVLASLNDPAWTDMFFQKIHEQQDQHTGTWPTGRTNISRTFAYTALHLAVGRIPPMPDRIVEAMLRLQTDDGIWETGLARFHTMDAIYLLTRLPALIQYRQAEAHAALVRASAALRERFVQHQAQYFDNPHSMLALTHSFGLLQETFPHEYPSQRPYRFDWDTPALYRCAHITPDMPAIQG